MRTTTTSHDDIARLLLADEYPRMVGKADLGRVVDYAKKTSGDGVFLEMGPWLGYLSHALAEHGTLHVVDNFQWTANHEKRVPGVVPVGESFRPLFEALIAQSNQSVITHETAFWDFVWSEGDIELLLIDSPKTARGLMECLAPVIQALSQGGFVLIKNGLNPKHHDMMAYIDRLVRHGVFAFDADNDAASTNILALQVAAIGPDAAQDLVELLDVAVDAAPLEETDDLSGPRRIVQLVQLIEAGALSEAFSVVAAMEPDASIISMWEDLEHTISSKAVSPTDLAAFSEILIQHNDPMAASRDVQNLTASPMAAVRAFWANNAEKPWRCEAFAPAILQRASAFGYMNWPERIADLLPGKDVLDVGCGSGLHGLGCLALGANAYCGVDPALQMDNDRVKNLKTRKRESFGWTPERISQAVSPWDAQAEPFETWETERTFDLVLLYDVLAHVDDVTAVIEKAADLLRPGGQIIIRHKNFYSWTGHSQAPKTVDAINMADPEQAKLVDWGHLTWDAPEDHYIRRRLNRVRLDDLIGAVANHFDIEALDENLSTEKTGLGRLTPDIQARHPDLSERDFNVHWVSCVAVVK